MATGDWRQSRALIKGKKPINWLSGPDGRQGISKARAMTGEIGRPREGANGDLRRPVTPTIFFRGVKELPTNANRSRGG